jgi:outer membrane immunogenic protein
MKKLALALTAIVAFAAPALAADIAAKAPVRAPAPVAYAPSWTGFWISGGFGYGLMDIDHSVTGATAPFPVFDFGHDIGGRGWLGKVGVGYDFQGWPWSNVVIGAFTDGQWSNIKGHGTFFCPGGCTGPFEFNGQFKNDWSWAAGGRIGYVALPGLLAYFNGGWTEANFKQVNFLSSGSGTLPAGTAAGLVLPSQRLNGYFLGGGTEYAINWIPGLFWKSEYRFADYGNHTTAQVCTVSLAGGCGAAGTIHSLDRSHPYVQTATTELVYRFNWGGPAATKVLIPI